jgi:hypothetical protein
VRLNVIARNISTLPDRKTGNPEGWFHAAGRATIGALGSDIINAAFAIYEMASEPVIPQVVRWPMVPCPPAAHYTTVTEKRGVLSILTSDIHLRQSQVAKELETADYEQLLLLWVI